MEKTIQFFAFLNFFVIGVSHILQRSVWVEYFAKLHSLGRLGPFAEGFLCLNFGALIVSFHNLWTFPEALLTLIGWTQIVKALVRFTLPGSILLVYKRMGTDRAWQIQIAGVLFVMLSSLFLFTAIQ